MQDGKLIYVACGNLLKCFLYYLAIILFARIFPKSSSLWLTAGIVFCIVLPYSKWGLKLMYYQKGWAKIGAVDFHRRAQKGFLHSEDEAREGHVRKDGKRPLPTGFKQLPSSVSICCRFVSAESVRQPDNIV